MIRWMQRAVVFGVVAIVVVGARPFVTVDREGYQRDPSLWDLFFPQLEGAYRASIIKSLQQGIIIVTPTTTGTATITAVATAYAYVELTSYYSGSPRLDQSIWLVLTDATTVTANIVTDAGADPEAGYTVVEHWPNTLVRKEDYQFDLPAATTSDTDALSPAVVVAKTKLVNRGASADTADTNAVYQRVWTKHVLTNTTTVTGTRASGTTTNVVAYGTAVEFR